MCLVLRENKNEWNAKKNWEHKEMIKTNHNKNGNTEERTQKIILKMIK
jgi:hypothetical protein